MTPTRRVQPDTQQFQLREDLFLIFAVLTLVVRSSLTSDAPFGFCDLPCSCCSKPGGVDAWFRIVCLSVDFPNMLVHPFAPLQFSRARAGTSSNASLTVSAKGIAFPPDIEYIFGNYTPE